MKKQKVSILNLKMLIECAESLSFSMPDALQSNNPKFTEEVFDLYEVWKIDCISLLKQLNSNELSVFAHNDGVAGLSHLLTTGSKRRGRVGNIRVWYKGEKRNHLSQDQIRQMESAIVGLKERKEALVRVLRILETKKDTDATVDSNFLFYFNRASGELSRYPKEKNKSCSFAIKKGRYKLIVTLIEEKDNDDDRYVSTEELTQASGYKSTAKCREGIHAIRENVAGTFKKIKGDEFIETKQRDGYRIGKKITILFEDTP